MLVVADIHERQSGVPHLLRERGANLRVKGLRVGDYHLPSGAIVERKTVRGMHLGIVGGTFWPQLGRRALLTRFGSVAAVLAAEPNDWEAVTGIGPQKAKFLAETLRSPYPN